MCFNPFIYGQQISMQNLIKFLIISGTGFTQPITKVLYIVYNDFLNRCSKKSMTTKLRSLLTIFRELISCFSQKRKTTHTQAEVLMWNNCS